MFVTTTTTERISGWRSKLRQAEKGQKARRSEPKSSQCRGSAACIIATIWLPEPFDQPIFKRIAISLKGKCVCRAHITRFAMYSSRFAITQRPGLSRRLLPETPQSSGFRLIFASDGILARDSIKRIRMEAIGRHVACCVVAVLNLGTDGTFPNYDLETSSPCLSSLTCFAGLPPLRGASARFVASSNSCTNSSVPRGRAVCVDCLTASRTHRRTRRERRINSIRRQEQHDRSRIEFGEGKKGED